LIRNCQVWDGTGTVSFTAEVLVDGGRIRQLQRGSGTLHAPVGVEVIDALGMTPHAPGEIPLSRASDPVIR